MNPQRDFVATGDRAGEIYVEAPGSTAYAATGEVLDDRYRGL
jgi:hypothetical protein